MHPAVIIAVILVGVALIVGAVIFHYISIKKENQQRYRKTTHAVRQKKPVEPELRQKKETEPKSQEDEFIQKAESIVNATHLAIKQSSDIFEKETARTPLQTASDRDAENPVTGDDGYRHPAPEKLANQSDLSAGLAGDPSVLFTSDTVILPSRAAEPEPMSTTVDGALQQKVESPMAVIAPPTMGVLADSSSIAERTGVKGGAAHVEDEVAGDPASTVPPPQIPADQEVVEASGKTDAPPVDSLGADAKLHLVRPDNAETTRNEQHVTANTRATVGVNSEQEDPVQKPGIQRIMVVDDSKVVRIKTGRLLTDLGYLVSTAEDGADALQMISEQACDLVITDVEMPNIDGFELVGALRRNPETAKTPIIMITSNILTHKQQAQEMGVNGFFGKPYDEQGLVAAIEALTGMASPHKSQAG